MPPRTFPSFALVVSSSSRDSFSLPDYYRPTRVETYGPYYRQSEPQVDLMKTIDIRRRESFEFNQSFLLPDIFEDEEIEIQYKPDGIDRSGLIPPRNGRDLEGHEGRKIKHPPCLCWLKRLILSLLRKCRGQKVHVIKRHEADSKFDLSE